MWKNCGQISIHVQKHRWLWSQYFFSVCDHKNMFIHLTKSHQPHRKKNISICTSLIKSDTHRWAQDDLKETYFRLTYHGNMLKISCRSLSILEMNSGKKNTLPRECLSAFLESDFCVPKRTEICYLLNILSLCWTFTSDSPKYVFHITL